MGLTDELFDAGVWGPALRTYGAATQLTVAIYDIDQHLVAGPLPSTPLFARLEAGGATTALFGDCARQCLEQGSARTVTVVDSPPGLAVVGTSLLLEGQVVGVAVAGCALVDFPQSTAIARLARQADVPFTDLWEVVRHQQPIPRRRLLVLGELLQVLGDSLLRENLRTRQYESVNAQLRETSSAKDEFLAVLSHELRSPLTPILGWARMLKTGGNPAKIEHAADVIERNTLLQLSLVDDLLDLNRATRNTMVLDVKTLDIREVVSASIDAVADQAQRKSLALTCEPCDAPVVIRGDPNRLQQIFRNVLLNAVKFTPSRGAVTVTIAEEGGRAVVHVRDTGEGMTPEFIPHAFDIFRQQEKGTRRSHGGLGIGLALVRQLMEAHDASVSLTSEGVGRGTDVTLSFPLAIDAEPEGMPATIVRPAVQELDGLRVLVVEDLDDAREALRLMLERWGADVVATKDGREALEVMAAASIDMVLCDLRMPRMDGFEFLGTLDLQGPRPPVIAVSGFASGADHRRTRAAGFDGHLDKPFDDVRLLAAVGEVMARRATRRD